MGNVIEAQHEHEGATANSRYRIHAAEPHQAVYDYKSRAVSEPGGFRQTIILL